MGYRSREVATRIQIPHSLQPGTLEGVSASATGSYGRFFRPGERRCDLRKASPVMLSRRISGRVGQGPGDQLEGCGDSPRRRGLERTQEPVGKGWR